MEIVTLPNGYKVPVDDCLGKFQLMHQKVDHDDWLLDQLKQYILPGSSVVDGGAFNGDHAIRYMDYMGERGTLYCFEPNEPICDLLVHNTMKKRKDMADCCIDVQTSNCALGDRECWVGLEHVAGNIGMTHAVAPSATVPGAVKVVMLDMMADKPVDFIKLDLEGWEFKALMGARLMLRRWHPTLLIEINRSALKRQGDTPDKIFELVGDMGYAIRSMQPDVKDDSPQYDILCERP